MKLRTKLAGAAALVLALGIGTYAYTAHSQEARGTASARSPCTAPA